MKTPLPICVRFHTTPGGSRILMLTCAESGRPIDCQTGVKLEYDVEAGSFAVDSSFLVPAEEVNTVAPERETLASPGYIGDPEDEEEEYFEAEEELTGYGKRIGFKR